MRSLTLCRFDGQNLVREDFDILNISYIAISHLWMEKECKWTKIPGIPFEAFVSPQKAKFIEEDLPALVGPMPFWMDVLAVDQSIEDEKIKIVERIPDIYRNAVKTIVVREDYGFRECCLPLFDDSRRDEIDDGLRKQFQIDFQLHLDKHLSDWAGEIWLQRLWPLQEANLSRSLQFVVCKGLKKDVPGAAAARGCVNMLWSDSGEFPLSYKAAAIELYHAAYLWAFDSHHILVGARQDWKNSNAFGTYCSEILKTFQNLRVRFIKAVLTNGSVTRELTDHPWNVGHPRSPFTFLAHSPLSPRKTGKPRDFVLALFPSFSWYKQPTDVRKMSFGEIWADSVAQLCSYHDSLAPLEYDERFKAEWRREAGPPTLVKAKITEGVLRNFHVDIGKSASPATSVPEPYCLGDFSNLFTLQYDLLTVDSDSLGIRSGVWRFILPSSEADLDIDSILMVVSENLSRYGPYNFFELSHEAMRVPDPRLDPDPASGIHDVNVQEALVILREISQLYLLLYEATEKPKPEGVCILPFAKEWHDIKIAARQKDSLAFRKALLRVAAHMACGLSMNTLNWSQGKLEPYILAFGDAAQGRYGAFRILGLAAPDLQGQLQESDEISVFGKSSPYIVVRSRRDNMQSRIIGLGPESRIGAVTNEASRYFARNVRLDRGCPVVLQTTEKGFNDRIWLKAYHDKLWAEMDAEITSSSGTFSLALISVAMEMFQRSHLSDSIKTAQRWDDLIKRARGKILKNSHESLLSEDAFINWCWILFQCGFNAVAVIDRKQGLRKAPKDPLTSFHVIEPVTSLLALQEKFTLVKPTGATNSALERYAWISASPEEFVPILVLARLGKRSKKLEEWLHQELQSLAADADQPTRMFTFPLVLKRM